MGGLRVRGDSLPSSLSQADQILEGGGSVNTSTILRLKYLIYKNLATIARETGDLSAAVDAYIQVHVTLFACHVTVTCYLFTRPQA